MIWAGKTSPFIPSTAGHSRTGSEALAKLTDLVRRRVIGLLGARAPLTRPATLSVRAGALLPRTSIAANCASEKKQKRDCLREHFCRKSRRLYRHN